MDRASIRSMERPTSKSLQDQNPPVYASPYAAPTAQPPVHLPYADPFHSRRDPFWSGAPPKRDAYGGSGSAWSPQGNIKASATAQSQTLVTPSSSLLPTPVAQMPPSLDTSQRRSSAGSPLSQQYGRNSLDSVSAPMFAPRAMPPPISPPQMSSISSIPPPVHHHSNSQGTPLTSPYSGLRDFGASHRSAGGMSISSMLGAGDEIKSGETSQPPSNGSQMNIRSTSPGRARSASFREMTGHSDGSPARARAYAEPRAASAFVERSSEPRKGSGFGSIRFARESAHSFRSFQPQRQEPHSAANGGHYGRPTSQPIEPLSSREDDGKVGLGVINESKFPPFRPLEKSQPTSSYPDEVGSRSDQETARNEPKRVGNVHIEEQRRYDPSRYPIVRYGIVPQEQSTGGFRPAQNPPNELAHESIEPRPQIGGPGREHSRSSPAASDASKPEPDRSHPLSFEEQPRSSATPQSRRAIEGSLQRSVFSISPELSRKGRNSPLPQAVQGVQPRHIGPGGDNPGIKIEFGRMFSGLGSGVGSTPPITGHGANGTTTPSRPSPMRQLDESDNLDVGGSSSKPSRGGAKRPSSRRPRTEVDKIDVEEQTASDAARGVKRARVTHHHHHHHVHPHHHHHHYHEPVETQSGSFSMLRFPSNTPASNTPSVPAQHHHHHHSTHAHPTHHHHHPTPPAVRKATVTVLSKRVLEDCAKKPRHHLGSQLYAAQISLPSTLDACLDRRVKYNSTANSIPRFEGRENCTFTIRVPRWYFSVSPLVGSEDMSPFEEICRRRQVWGTYIYSDDSDVVAAAVHSGWLEGYFGEDTKDLQDLVEGEAKTENGSDAPPSTLKLPKRPLKVRPGHDVHITILVLPPLETYVSTLQNHILSRDWRKTHDGMSFTVHRVDFVDEGPVGRSMERTASARKARIATEEAKRQEAADVLLMFARAEAEPASVVA